MYISRDGRYGYLAPPKTGSNSIRDFLLRHGWKQLGRHHDILFETNRCERVACSVREHHRTIESWWVLAGAGFPFNDFVIEFLKKGLVRSNLKRLYDERRLFGPFTRYATDIIHIEQVGADIKLAFPEAFEGKILLPRLGVTTWPDGRRPEWTDENWDLVNEQYQDEIINLGYNLTWKSRHQQPTQTLPTSPSG